MIVDYNKISEKFSQSRDNMKWEEIDYFKDFISDNELELEAVLDIGCGSGRLIEHFGKSGIHLVPENYLGVDLSEGMIDEAKKRYPPFNFLSGDMLDIRTITEEKKYKYVFLIASFHHLNSYEKREKFMRNIYELMPLGGYIFMTHWSLKSEINKEKYKDSEIVNSENEFGSSDFMIKMGDIQRYYHCFDTKELEKIFVDCGFSLIENREFENKRNIISIAKK